MVNYKEILRLSHEGYSQRQLESSLHCSRHTIREVLTAAKANGITYPLDDSFSNEQLEAILFPNRYASDNAYLTPRFRIHPQGVSEAQGDIDASLGRVSPESRDSRQAPLHANTVRRQVPYLGTRNEGDNAYPPQARRRHGGRLGGSDITHLRLGDR